MADDPKTGYEQFKDWLNKAMDERDAAKAAAAKEAADKEAADRAAKGILGSLFG